MEFEELLKLVNKQLEEGKSLISIAKKLGLNESSIRKRLNRKGYKRKGNKFVPKECITSNITSEIAKESKQSSHKEIKNIDYDKLNLLLDNLDKILKLIPN